VRGLSWNNLLASDESYSTKWRTASDIRITPDKALQSTVILSCCRIIAETIATLPLCVYRRKSDGSQELAYDVPLYKVLHFAPNSWQTKFEFIEQVCMHIGLWGNSYSQIISGRYGAVTELQNLHPSRMQVERLENGRLRYSYTNPQTGRLERYTQDQIMHVRWTPEPDGIKGMVPIEVSRDAIALARSLEIHASKFWANSARPGVVLTTDGSLSAESAERLRDNWERIHRGSERAYKTAILTNGLKATELGFTNEASQFVDSRKYQCEELCRVYRIPMHLVQGTSGGNLEVQGQEFVTYTLMPWLERIQAAISRSLIYNDDLLFAAFDVRGLLRSDSNSRAGYYSTMMGLGIYSVNEVRSLEGLAPLGPEADKHFVAMNMQTLEDAAKPKPDPSQMPGAPPPPATGGVPSLPGVKTGEAPKESEKGEASTKKPEMEDAIEESSADWEDAIEGRAFCATGEGNGTDNSCSSSGAGVAEVDNSWKKSDDRDYYYEPGEGDSPVAGGDDIKSISIERPKEVAAAMKSLKIKSLTDVVAISGGLTRGASTFLSVQRDAIAMTTEVPVDPDDESQGFMSSEARIGVDGDGKRFVDYKVMSAASDSGELSLSGESAARMSSILLEKFPESLAAAERAGLSYAKTFAIGDSTDEWQGYRLWPQFGFDAELDEDVINDIPDGVLSPDAGSPPTIQELISTTEGDKWWKKNGSSTGMSLNFKDKKSDGYKRFQKTLALAKRLKKRNEGRSLFEILFPEYRGFCPTGEGGGIDNSCGGEEGGSSSPAAANGKGGSCPAPCHEPDVNSDKNKDGVTDAARVGCPAFEVPPPPAVGRVPNLDPYQRSVEDAFISHFESDPEKVSSQFRDLVVAQGDPPTFGTDDAKCLTSAWSHPDPEVRAENRATLNTILHQTANAIAKRAFLQHLDTLKEGDEIMVTVGGCGAGKGFALKNVPAAMEMKSRAKVVWDSAGDQNATENPWILKEAESRGLKVNYVFVHADPQTQWADPDRGVVKRASDPKDGRMVDAKVFADSYAIGAKNHHAFHQANKDNKSASFVFLDNTSGPKQVAGVPKEALSLDADKLAAFAESKVQESSAPPRVKAGALLGRRIWGKK
jgi:HK97 family phage portal protein